MKLKILLTKIRLRIKFIFKGNLNEIYKKLFLNFNERFFFLNPKNLEVNKFKRFFIGKKGIRIGGEISWKFNKFLKSAKQILDVNLSKDYLGEENKVDYLTSATNLYFAKDNEFDFVCSSHLLEHLTNPLRAINEWKRVIKEGGVIYCAVPDKRYTFDYKRKTTPLSHIIKDYKEDTNTQDEFHVNEFIKNWAENMDLVSKKEFIHNIKLNPIIYTHNHVWEKQNLMDLFKYAGLKIEFVVTRGNTIHLIAKKI